MSLLLLQPNAVPMLQKSHACLYPSGHIVAHLHVREQRSGGIVSWQSRLRMSHALLHCTSGFPQDVNLIGSTA